MYEALVAAKHAGAYVPELEFYYNVPPVCTTLWDSVDWEKYARVFVYCLH